MKRVWTLPDTLERHIAMVRDEALKEVGDGGRAYVVALDHDTQKHMSHIMGISTEDGTGSMGVALTQARVSHFIDIAITFLLFGEEETRKRCGDEFVDVFLRAQSSTE
jgi:hypothetical protein